VTDAPTDLALVMPMAGRGSRFARAGHDRPKPLIELFGRPFFWWATESVRRRVALRELLFVVLREHVEAHGIDAAIRAQYPEARLAVIDEVTEGAAETARIGLEALSTDGPVAINDCDHAFACEALPSLAAALASDTDAALLCFRADSPNFSYACLDAEGRVTGTVEKRVASPFAIAGCYLFRDRATFAGAYVRFREDCAYDELFLSGVVDRIAREGGRVALSELRHHAVFGTPEEMARLDPGAMTAGLGWGPGS